MTRRTLLSSAVAAAFAPLTKLAALWPKAKIPFRVVRNAAPSADMSGWKNYTTTYNLSPLEHEAIIAAMRRAMKKWKPQPPAWAVWLDSEPT